MLERLRLTNVGPAPHLEMELAPRLNLLTGDNGLGKSFLLDVAWWALTYVWPQDLNSTLTSGYRALPTHAAQAATIEVRTQPPTGLNYTSQYIARGQHWLRNAGQAKLTPAALVVYALAEGSLAVWDPARNSWKKQRHDEPETIAGYVFNTQDVWNGLTIPVDGKPTRVCNGLIADWASWIRERGVDAARMASVLRTLTMIPGHTDGIEVGTEFSRLSINDARDIPAIRTGYGQDVPIVHAALGVRRITALAYMLSWAWREHVIAAKQLGESPTNHVVLLIDEVEAHLHPRWQRVIIPALLKVFETLTGDHGATSQIIVATHSPLVLASVEPRFDTAQDKLFTLDLVDGEVQLHEQPWAKQGDVVNWLVSDSFGLAQGRSLEAERAIEAAEAWMRGERAQLPAGLTTKDEIHAELQRVLAGHDPFWPRWVVFAEKTSAP